MKTKLLPSLRERWKELMGINEKELEAETFITKYGDYLDFTEQPPKLYMFVNLLDKPKIWAMYKTQMMECSADEMRRCREWQQAQDKILFEGFEVLDDHKEDSILFPLKNGGCIYYYTVDNTWKLNHKEINTLADLSGKVYLNSNGIKQAGI